MDINKEELKNETKETVNQVKDSFKDVDFNKEAKETHGFVKGMCVEPFETVERVARGEQEVFKRAVMLLVIHIAAATIYSIIYALKYGYGTIASQLWDIIVSGISPIIAILVPTILIVLMNKANKKPATAVISTLVVASIPSIAVAIIDVVELLLSKIYMITSPISTTLSAIAILLSFVGMKTLFNEEKGSFLGKFAIIKVLTALVLYII